MSKKKDKIAAMSEEEKTQYLAKRKKKRIITWAIVGSILFVILLNFLILPLTGKAFRTKEVIEYTGTNKYICFDDALMLSAHRAGGDLEPEETMAAFKLCMEATDYVVDIVEFDLHLTKDNELVLLHDDTVNRTSNATEHFGSKKVKAKDKTLAELKELNFGENFVDPNGNAPYKGLRGNDIPNDVKITTLDEILTYLTAKQPTLNYIIEIKDGGKTGEVAMDALYNKMVQYNIVNQTIVGTFQDNVTRYIDKKYPSLTRSASIAEFLDFYYAFLYGNKNKEFKFKVLQIPMGADGIFNFHSKAFISFAHSKGMAVQYWTINDADKVKRLKENGADCIMTDNPSMAYKALHE
ncbi:MAG: hypothetical protein J5656_00935 [Clostridia bacterium]|nr:hypothetical protein [Clostridia bacterium]